MSENLLSIGLNNAIVAAGLALVVFVLTRYWRHAPLAHLLWLVVLVKLVTPPLFDFPMPIRLAPTSVVAIESPPPTRTGEVIAPDAVVVVSSGLDTTPEDARKVGPDASTARRRPIADIEISPTVMSVTTWRTWSRALLGVWLGGALIVMSIACFRLHQFRLFLRRAAVAPRQLEEEVADVVRETGVRTIATVRVTGARIAPLIFGFRHRSMLLLPESLMSSLSAEERLTVIAHELAHLQRRDHWRTWFELVVVSLYWWHPIAWFARRQLRRTADECCDGWVVKWFPDKAISYADSMMKTLDFLAGGARPMTGLASGFGQLKSLKRRFEMVLRNQTAHRLTPLLRFSVCTAASVLLLISPAFSFAEIRRGASATEAGDESRPTANNSTRTEPAHGPAKDGLAAFLVFHKRKFKIGEAIPVFYGVAFSGDRGIKISPPMFTTGENCGSWFSIVGPDGQKRPFLGPAGWPRNAAAVTLRYGDLHGRHTPDLAELHKLDEPGTYSIVWNYHAHAGGGPWRGRLLSNKVQFQVVR